MNLTLQQAQQLLAAQPFSRLVGARLVAFGDGSATLEIDIHDELRQQFGMVHGGVLAYAADNVTTFAAGSLLGPNVLTAGVSVNYLRPARDGVLRADATVVHANAKQAVCTAELTVGPTVCTIATATILATGRDPIRA